MTSVFAPRLAAHVSCRGTLCRLGSQSLSLSRRSTSTNASNPNTALATRSVSLRPQSSRAVQSRIHLVNSRHRRASTAPTANQANPSSPSSTSSQADLADGLSDQPLVLDESGQKIDWARSFHGLSTEPFSKEASDVLLKSIPSGDIEVKPDGIIYLPEIKYRRILNQAFGPGAWGLAPRGETIVTGKSVTREYALVVHGRLVSIARGEMDYFSSEGIPTAAEGCKSNALMRCCKDLGVASELWDPRFIRKFISQHAKEVWAEHVVSKKKRKLWVRKEDEVPYPYKESKGFGA